MDTPGNVPRDLWQQFLTRPGGSAAEQEAFLDSLTRPDAPPVDTLMDLDVAYRRFLRLGAPPLDIHEKEHSYG